MKNVMKKSFINNMLIFSILGILVFPLFSADKKSSKNQNSPLNKSQLEGPVVEDNSKWHKIGTLWNRVTNFSFMGDDAYDSRTPSCDYPGGSGNSYLYRGTLQLTLDRTHPSRRRDARVRLGFPARRVPTRRAFEGRRAWS